MRVRLHLGGFLGQKYGPMYEFEVARIKDAVRALAVQVPEFSRDVTSYFPGFHVIVGDEDLGEHQIGMKPAHEDIYLIPAIVGGGGDTPWLQIVVGVALIALTYGAAGGYVGAAAWGGAAAAHAVQAVGISMVLGGISQLLYSAPKFNTPGERPENTPSYIFSGAVNAEAQGHPVPLHYGLLRVGSIVVSAGIETVQIFALEGSGDGETNWDDWTSDGGGGWIGHTT